MKVTQVVSTAPNVAAASGSSAPASRYAPRKPTNCVTMISGPGVVSAMPRPSSISPARQPAVGLDRLLRDIGEHRISAAEGDHRHLAEEDGDAAEHVVGAEQRPASGDRPQPQQQERRRDPQRPAPVGPRMVGQLVAERGVAVGDVGAAARVPIAAGERGDAGPRGEEADQPGGEDDHREGHVEHEDRDEGRGGERPFGAVAQATASRRG